MRKTTEDEGHDLCPSLPYYLSRYVLAGVHSVEKEPGTMDIETSEVTCSYMIGSVMTLDPDKSTHPVDHIE